MSAPIDIAAAEESFISTMQEAGLLVSAPLQTDRLVRVDVEGHRKGNKAGWYRYFSDGLPSGAYGSWYEGETHTWCARNVAELSPADRAAYRARMAETDRARKVEKAEKEQAAASEAATEWAAASEDCSRATYLGKKNVKALGVRAAGNVLLVPVQDIDGKLWSRQAIHADGEKWFLEDGRITACFHVIGSLEGAKRAALCEGYATGATIHEATGLPVIVAFFAGNLEPVGKAIRSKHPSLRLLVCADDDAQTPGNPGVTKGKATGKAIDAEVAIPDFGANRPAEVSDFNDLAQLRGLPEVKAQIEKVIAATSLQLASALVQTIFSRQLPPPIETPFPQLNTHLGGGLRGVNVVAGATGRGKTGFGLTQARFTARTRPVLYLSTEIDERQAMARIAAQDRGCPWRPLYEGTAPDTLTIVAGALAGLRLYVATCNSVETMLAKLSELANVESEPALLVLDYLQGLSRSAEDRRLAVGAASEALTAWTRATGGTAEVISSISRAHYFDTDAKSATDFVGVAKESGDVEFDASSVMFVDVPPPALGGSSEGRLHVAKARFGSAGTIGLFFDGPSGCFQADPAGGLTDDQRAVMEAIEDGARSGNAIAKEAGIRRVKVEACLRVLRSRNLIDASNHPTGQSRKPGYKSPKNAAMLPGNTLNVCPDTETVDGSPSEKAFPGDGKQAVLVDGVSPPYRGKPGNTGDLFALPNHKGEPDDGEDWS